MRYKLKELVLFLLEKDLSVMQDTPFTDQGSVGDIFTDMNVWMGIRKVIELINANAA